MSHQQQSSQQPPRSLSLAQRCYADALHCCFSYLSLGEAVRAGASCLAWRSALLREPQQLSRRAVVAVQHAQAFEALCRAPLRRQVASLRLCSSTFLPGPLQLQAVCTALPHLTSIDCAFLHWPLQRVADDDAATMQFRDDYSAFPRGIQSATFRFVGTHQQATLLLPIDALVHCVGNNLTELHLHFDDLSNLNLLPLLKFPVASLTLPREPLGQQQFGIIKRMESLRELRQRGGGQWGHDSMHQLCTGAPVGLQRLFKLARIDLSETALTPGMVQLLSQLPALTELSPKHWSVQCFRLLPQIPHLRIIGIDIPQSTCPAAVLDDIFESLSSCPSLEEVCVRSVWSSKAFAADYMERVVRAMPRLKRLELQGVFVRNLSFLSQTPSLTELRLECCANVAASQVIHLARWVPALRKLAVRDSIVLREEEQLQVRLALRELRAFEYHCDPTAQPQWRRALA